MTGTPIDLAAVRSARDDKSNGPDADQTCIIVKDGKPQKWFKFSVAFNIDDAEFTFHIWALDFADADRRVAAIKSTAKVSGQIMAEVPA
jgi:hypothetical protein